MVLPVKVSIDQVTHMAHTVDITGTGARLGGFQTQLQPGTIIGLQRGPHKAKFRIQWIQQLGPKEIQVGVESLEPNASFWGVDLRDREREAQNDIKALMTLLSSGAKSGS
jgi:hypothetical protein